MKGMCRNLLGILFPVININAAVNSASGVSKAPFSMAANIANPLDFFAGMLFQDIPAFQNGGSNLSLILLDGIVLKNFMVCRTSAGNDPHYCKPENSWFRRIERARCRE
jgi:hypothetical protein